MELTVYCIAKNEAQNIGLMLSSIKDIADEIVVCDTGSTDDTVLAARRFTDKVYEIPWENSFSKARNRALEFCTGDWILQLDCDEVLEAESAKRLRGMIEKLPPTIDVVLLSLIMRRDDGSDYQEFLAERLWRNGRGVKFQGDMHNYLDWPVDESRINVPLIKIIHNRGVKSELSRQERAAQRLEMAEEIFIKKIEGEPADKRSMFYLAGTYFDSDRTDDARHWFEEYLRVSDENPEDEWTEERYQAAYLLAECYERLGDRKKAIRTLSAALVQNWRRAECLYMLGELCLADDDASQAVHWFKCASLLPQPVDPLFVERDVHTWKPHNGLWHAYRRLGDHQKAAEHGRQAIAEGAPNAGEITKWEKNHTEYGAERIAVLVDRGQMDFIAPVIAHWEGQGQSVRVGAAESDVGELSQWADIVFCEWAGELAAKVTSLPKGPRIIVRVHGYETHSGLLEQVDWLAVDDVIFVADYLRDLAFEQYPVIAEACNVYVVPGGVETGKFSIAEGKQGNKIAMACYLNQKKNLPLAMQILAKLPEKYELHIAGEWQDHRLQMYIGQLIAELGLEKRVFWYPWQEDLNGFYKDKDIYLSSSEEESFHYALAEAMASGLKPVIHCWKSAEDFYDDKWVFMTVDEAVALIKGKRKPEEYRQYAIDHLDIRRNLKRIDRILARPSVAVSGEPKYQYAGELEVGRALERLGCRTDAPEPKMVLIMGTNPRLEPWMGAAKTVHWVDDKVGDTERDIDGREARAKVLPDIDLVLVQNSQWVDALRTEDANRVRYFPLLGACAPFRKLNAEKEFDVGFYGASTEHRNAKLEQLAEKFNVGFLSDCYDHEQVNTFINKSRVIVNLHAYDPDSPRGPIIEWRLAQSMAAGACVVSERLPEGHPFPTDVFVETDDVAEAIERLLDDDVERERIARRAHSWVWRHLRLDHRCEALLDVVGL